jgi:hypothetical protein
MFELLIVSLAGWRIASLLVEENGPFEIFAKLRDVAGVQFDERGERYANNEFGKMLCCIWCTSVWTCAAMLAMITVFPQLTPVAIALSASAVAIAVNKVINSGAL